MSELRDARPELDERTDLSKCPIEECESPLVYPINWVNDYLPQGWDMSGGVVMCRCPNCEWRGVGFHDELTIYEFDKTLDEGTDTLISNLKLLARANMKDTLLSAVLMHLTREVTGRNTL